MEADRKPFQVELMSGCGCPWRGRQASHPHPVQAAAAPPRRACQRHHTWVCRGCRGGGAAPREVCREQRVGTQRMKSLSGPPAHSPGAGGKAPTRTVSVTQSDQLLSGLYVPDTVLHPASWILPSRDPFQTNSQMQVQMGSQFSHL